MTKIRFDCLVVIMMLLFFIDKERRTPDKWSKAAVGIYVRPAFDNITGQGVPGGSLVFSDKSKRVRNCVTWKTLDKPQYLWRTFGISTYAREEVTLCRSPSMETTRSWMLLPDKELNNGGPPMKGPDRKKNLVGLIT